MKIIKIQKKPWYLRIFTIECWWAWVDDGVSVKRHSICAGVTRESVDDFMWSLKEKVSFDPESLVGKEF